jgi:hypothetical protein
MEKCYSLNEEDWYMDFEFVRDELESCAGEGESILGKTYYEADQEPIAAAGFFDIDDLIDLLNEKAWDVCGECAEDYPNLSLGKKEELNKIVLDFLDKNTRHYYKPANIVEKKVEEGDL